MTTIGNYKGVMLCNRPFGGQEAATKVGGAGTSSENASFSCGVVPETIGISVSVIGKERHKIKRPKKDTALMKHKKWLAELQSTKEELEQQYNLEQQRKNEAKEKFQERESKIRQMTRADGTTINHTGSETNSSMHAKPDKDADSKPETNIEPKESENEILGDKRSEQGSRGNTYFPSISNSSLNTSFSTRGNKNKSKKNKNKGGNKPIWSMAEADAKILDATSTIEGDDKEVDSLLAFVNDLDFDKFVGDLEVKTMMERVRDRIKVLEKEVQMEAQREAEQEEKNNEEMSDDDDEDNSTTSDENNEGNDNVLLAARTLLKNVGRQKDSLTTVHSAKSVASMMIRMAATTSANNNNTEKSSQNAVINEPIIATHEPFEGNRMTNKAQLANLPYMHRNPAV